MAYWQITTVVAFFVGGFLAVNYIDKHPEPISVLEHLRQAKKYRENNQ